MMNIKAHGSEENYGIDRISSLPDDVLMHILSFVSTREAVHTCILSKRWIKTWASVSDLEFDIKDFGRPKFLDGEMEMDVEEFVTKFKLFVKNVLEKRETSCVNRFRLWLDSDVWPCTQAAVNCICDVMKLEPQECLVKLCSYENLNLNMDVIFTCALLVYLQLCLAIEVHSFVVIEPNSVNLPCLKTLNLASVILSDDSFKKLLLGCPVLEELVLEGCHFEIIEIYSNTLKKLVLCSSYYVMRLQISAPNLVYLDIRVWGIEEFMLLNMQSLVDASIYINYWYDQDEYVPIGPKLIHSLSNVECLQLKFSYLDGEVLKKDFTDCSPFNNLKCLKLLDLLLDDFNLPLFFLLHSPKLQELTFEYNDSCVTEFVDEEITQEGQRDALVQREFLKTVRIVGFKNDNGFVDQLINKLLVHVKIIDEIDIVQ